MITRLVYLLLLITVILLPNGLRGQHHQHSLPHTDRVLVDPNEPGRESASFRWLSPKNDAGIWEYRLVVTDQQIRLANGTMYKVWAYGDRVPGPLLRAREGDRVRVTLVNETASNHTIHFHGVFVSPEMDGVPPWSPPVKPGESFTYDFVAKPAGTHFYHCHMDTNEHMNRGMSGAFVVAPRIPEPQVEKDLVLIIGEWNSKYAQDGRPGNPREVHDTDFFTINARSFPETTPVALQIGETARLRIINVGAQNHSIHLHGQQFLLTHKDGVALADPQLMDTVPISPGERVDLIVFADSIGEWPMHCHVAAHQTNAGMYPGGMMTHVRIVNRPGVPSDGNRANMEMIQKLWRASARRRSQ